MLIKLHQKNINFFHCELCDYKCSKRGDFNRHILTNKHIRLTETNKNASKNITQIQCENVCSCGKNYKHKSSLCKHKKTCNFCNDNTIITNKNNLENLVIQLMSENNEIKNTLIRENIELKQKINEKDNQINDLLPKLANITNNTINNNKFNINVFLNEKCKDAITINDFVDKIEISLKNLLTTREKGLGIGLSEIINENMNKLSIYERPIHCTDKKREVLYIKNDTWEKDKDLEKTREMFKGLQSHQFKSMKKWIKEHPNYMDDDNLKHEYMLLVNKCSSSLNEHENKIFKNLCDNTYLKTDILYINDE